MHPLWPLRKACQNVEVNETLSINWEDPNPRVLWNGGSTIGESSCVSCGHCVTVCPCNALMEKTMLGHAGLLTAIRESALSGMIDEVKGVEPETGYFLLVEMRTPPRGGIGVASATSCLLLPISTGAILAGQMLTSS